MAFIIPFVAWYVFRIIANKNASFARMSVAAFIAGYLSLNAAAIAAGIEFGIQPLIAVGTDGNPLYAPYPLSIALPAMALEHLVVFGVAEAMVTLLIFRYFFKHNKDFIEVLK